MRVSMKLGILHFAEVNLTMPLKQNPLDEKAAQQLVDANNAISQWETGGYCQLNLASR